MHKFIAHQETEALEIYWAELNHNDIQRENVGGASYLEKENVVEDGSILGNLFTKVE
jgi:hypothetical protein